jgi:hypothetical protein
VSHHHQRQSFPCFIEARLRPKCGLSPRCPPIKSCRELLIGLKLATTAGSSKAKTSAAHMSFRATVTRVAVVQRLKRPNFEYGKQIAATLIYGFGMIAEEGL